MTASPWADPAIARAMRENVDRQLAEVPWPVHFRAFADAVMSVGYGRLRGRVLEIGCGVGHGVAILDRAGIPYDEYSGVDLNRDAVAIASERYPNATFAEAEFGAYIAATVVNDYDVVVDGSCVLHVEDWRAHLGYLCGASRDAVILHRLPIHFDERATTSPTSTTGYGHEFPAWRFALHEVQDEMHKLGFSNTEARRADGDSLTLTFRKGK